MATDEVEELPAVISINFGVELGTGSLDSLQVAATPSALSPSPPPVSPDVLKISTRSLRHTMASLVYDIGRKTTWSAHAQDPGDFSQFFGGLAQGSEDAYMAGLSCWRLIQTVLTVHLSSVIVGLFFAISLASSGIWPVPGHKQATLWTGFLNRLVWSLSPVFLGGFFPGFCDPELMWNWRVHRYFLIISLLPFILADVAFPYIVGTDTHLKVFFSTCFWPTCTCAFFLPSMIAGIRRRRGDELWPELGLSQWRYIRAQGKHFLKDLTMLVVCFAAAVLPVNYIAFDFAVVLPNLTPSAAAVLRPLISTIIKISCFEVFKFAAAELSTTLRFFGLFPLAVNLGLHTAMSVVLCQDWLSVIIWIGCDFCNCFWRTLRTKRFGMLARRIDFLNFNDEEMRRRGFESVILGWGLTAALVSVLMVSPLAWVLPDMLWRFLFPRGRASVVYLLLVACCDGIFDTIALLITTHICRCDFAKVLGNHPFSATFQSAYLASLTVVWAPCALGCFGWVFQHMCIAAFSNDC